MRGIQAANEDVSAKQGSVGEIIRRDIPRTFPSHPKFTSSTPEGRQGQLTLARVLRAYSLYDTEVK